MKKRRKTTFDYFSSSNPKSLSFLMRKYIDQRFIQGYKETTLVSDRSYLSYFLNWCEERGFDTAAEISREIMDAFVKHIVTKNTKDGQRLKVRSQRNCIKRVRHFFKWLAKERILVYNPAADLVIPKRPKDLPREVLSVEETEHVLSQANLEKPLGIRDRAIMEVFYSTGIRRLELIHLHCSDLMEEEQCLRIRLGKGGNSRLVPIGKRALLWTNNYLEEARNKFIMDTSEQTLFVGRKGEPLNACYLGQRIKDYLKKAGIQKTGTCHLFRHTMATQMLKNGANIRVVQEILGHRKITTTQLYTHLTIEHLKKVHQLTHPAKYPKPEKQAASL